VESTPSRPPSHGQPAESRVAAGAPGGHRPPPEAAVSPPPPAPSPDWVKPSEAIAERRFLSECWIRAWAETLPPGGRWKGPLETLLTRDTEGEVSAVLPLATVRLGPGLGIRALAGPRQPFRGLVARQRDFATAMEELGSQLVGDPRWSALRFSSVDGGDIALDTLVTYLKLRGWLSHQRFLYLTLATPLPDSLDALHAQLGKRREKRFRHKESRLRREGPYEIRIHRDLEASAWLRVIEGLAEIERHSWLVKLGGETQFQSEAGRRFWQRVLSDPETRGCWGVFVLFFQGRPACYCLTADMGGTRYSIYNHYDDAFRPLSLGSIVDHDVFRDAIERGMKKIDFGHGDSGYKQQSLGASPDGSLRDVVVAAPTGRGRALFAASMGWSLVDDWRKARQAMAARQAEDTRQAEDARHAENEPET